MIYTLKGEKELIPKIDAECFIVDECVIAGDVEIGPMSSVWFYAVIRGDVDSIKIGSYTNIQDNASLHVTEGFPMVIGDYVTIAHGATVHGSKIGNNVLIGTGTIISDGVEIGDNSWIAAGSLVPPGKKIPANALVVGSPCKVKRGITQEEIDFAREIAIGYGEKKSVQYSR